MLRLGQEWSLDVIIQKGVSILSFIFSISIATEGCGQFKSDQFRTEDAVTNNRKRMLVEIGKVVKKVKIHWINWIVKIKAKIGVSVLSFLKIERNTLT